MKPSVVGRVPTAVAVDVVRVTLVTHVVARARGNVMTKRGRTTVAVGQTVTTSVSAITSLNLKTQPTTTTHRSRWVIGCQVDTDSLTRQSSELA